MNFGPIFPDEFRSLCGDCDCKRDAGSGLALILVGRKQQSTVTGETQREMLVFVVEVTGVQNKPAI